MLDYSGVLLFFVISSGLAFVIVGASYLLALRLPDPEKSSVYECGFDPFSDSRQKFEVRFFLVGILFIFADSLFAYWMMMLFLFILTIGLVYEWMKGGLEWE